MKTSRFTDNRILAIFEQVEAGSAIPELCREHGISTACFYKWRSRFGGMDALMLSQLKKLQDQNQRLEKVCAEVQLSADLLKGAGKSGEAISGAGDGSGDVSERSDQHSPCVHDIRLIETMHRHAPMHSDEDALIAERLVRPTTAFRDWGFGLCFLSLRKVKRFGWNHKRMCRICRELELNLLIKPKKRLVRFLLARVVHRGIHQYVRYRVARFTVAGRDSILRLPAFAGLASMHELRISGIGRAEARRD